LSFIITIQLLDIQKAMTDVDILSWQFKIIWVYAPFIEVIMELIGLKNRFIMRKY